MSPEEILKDLLENNFYCNSDGHLIWSWREGVTLHDMHPNLEQEIKTLYPDLFK